MNKDPCRRDFSPQTGVAVEVASGLRRMVVPNASPMTFTGTNTYLLGESSVAVIDPGPEQEGHLQALLAATDQGRRISHILVTHSHIDHSPLARRLGQVANAPVLALGDSFSGRSQRMAQLSELGDLGGGEGVDRNFRPDQCLSDGEVVVGGEWQVRAIATPGHFSNHLCFGWEDAVFSGDHVMGWATTLVSPPDGDLTAFMASLAKMQGRGDRVYYPGHGAPVEDPDTMLAYQIGHRKSREGQIMEALGDGPATAITLARRIYTEIDAALIPAAARNVFSHLLDLKERNLVVFEGALTSDSHFFRV